MTVDTPPLFSFVIPNFNYGHFLRECLESCLSQDINAEILVRDGGSTDSSLDVMKSFGDDIHWTSEPDNGQSDAINKGINEARGTYIAWINSDDFYPSEKPLKKIQQAVRDDPSIDFIYGDGLFVNAAGEPYKKHLAPADLTAKRLMINPYVGLLQPSVIFRRELFQSVGGLNLDYHFSMDLDLWLRMLQTNPRIAYIPEVLSSARIHEQAKTRAQIKQSIAETRQVLESHRSKVPLSLVEQCCAWASQRKVDLYEFLVEKNIYNPPV